MIESPDQYATRVVKELREQEEKYANDLEAWLISGARLLGSCPYGCHSHTLQRVLQFQEEVVVTCFRQVETKARDDREYFMSREFVDRESRWWQERDDEQRRRRDGNPEEGGATNPVSDDKGKQVL
jgi:hypothetical protein